MLRPQPKVLTIWRILLAAGSALPAFLLCLFLTVGGRLWMILAGLWLACFLFFYLYYLPVRYQKLTYTLQKDRLVVTSGVINTKIRSMPLANVQYVGMVVSPLDAIWGLCSLVVTAAGGRILLPGLRRQDALNMAELLPG